MDETLVKLLRAIAAAVLLGLVGCKTPKGPPEDPLFLNRTPIEVKPHAGPPVVVACSEPEMPLSPVALKDAALPKEPVPVEIIPPHN
jgi:hypothetical protein